MSGLVRVDSIITKTCAPMIWGKKYTIAGGVTVKATRRVAEHPPKDRSLYEFAGRVALRGFVAFSDSVENAATAVFERGIFEKYEGGYRRPFIPTEAFVFQALTAFTRLFRKCVSRTVPVDVLEFPKTYYRGRRLAQMERAAYLLVSQGASVADSYIRAFLKHEKLPYGLKRLVCRLIQPRYPVYAVALGRFLKPIEHSVYGIIAHIFGAPVVMKGYNCFQVGEMMHEAWASFEHPVAVMLDANRFDQHINSSLLKWEHHIYELFYGRPYVSEMKRLLRMQLHTRGVVRCYDGDIKYDIPGTRCSGDMNTALGNCLIMCAMIYVRLNSIGVRARVFDNGDDMCLVMNKRDVETFTQGLDTYFDSYGISLRVEGQTDVLERVSFCQTQPVYDGVRWRMVRDPRVSLTKDSTTLHRFNSQVELDAHLTALGQCGLALTCGLPVLQEYYQCLTRGLSSVLNASVLQRARDEISGTGMFYMTNGLSPEVYSVSQDARYSFACAFDIMPQEQESLECYYSGLAGIRNVVVPGTPRISV